MITDVGVLKWGANEAVIHSDVLDRALWQKHSSRLHVATCSSARLAKRLWQLQNGGTSKDNRTLNIICGGQKVQDHCVLLAT
jgi:hypothetical protein